MSARKTWSDNTIDERSIAFSSSRPNESTHAHARREFSLRPVCPVTRDLSFPPPFLPVLFLSFVYHGLLSPSYPYVTLTYRAVGLRVRASCCIRSLNWVSIFIGWPTGARRERSNAREISTNRPSPLRLILVLSLVRSSYRAIEWTFFLIIPIFYPLDESIIGSSRNLNNSCDINRS